MICRFIGSVWARSNYIHHNVEKATRRPGLGGIHRRGVDSSWQLTTNSARHREAGVHVGEETRRIIPDLLHLEPGAGVLTVCHKTGGEKTSLVSVPVGGLECVPVRFTYPSYIHMNISRGQCLRDSERPVSAGHSDPLLPDGRGRGAGGGLVFAAEADEPDAPADEIRVGIDAEVIVSRAAGQAAGECGAIDNLVGRGDDAVGRCEFEWAVCATTAGLRGCWVGWEVLAGPGRVIDAFPAAGGCWVGGRDG